MLSSISSEVDLWQFGSLISFGFGRHAIVTGDRQGILVSSGGFGCRRRGNLLGTIHTIQMHR